MRIKWYGHASFRITDAGGRSLITDPYPPERAGYKPVTETADIVSISSDDDSFHCRYDLIPGQPALVDALKVARSGGSARVAGLDFHAIETAGYRGEAIDHNAMLRFEMDGLSVAHMGDVGVPLNAEQVDFLAGVDVLLALTGGHPTLALDELMRVIRAAQPRLIIPMHFQTLRYAPRNLLWLPDFLAYFGADQVEFVCDDSLTLMPDTLAGPRVRVLSYA